jgi:hypothetical protein
MVQLGIIDPDQTITPQLVFIGALIVDGAHVYSTLLVSYFDKNINIKIRRHLIWAPIITIVFCYSLYIYDYKTILISFVGSFALFHFIRQEAGWMKLAGRLDSQQTSGLSNIDLLTSYTFTIVPITYLISERNKGFWLSSGDLPIISNNYWYIGKYLMLIAGCTWLIANVVHWRRIKIINSSKVLVMLNNITAWFVALTFLSGSWVGLLLIIVPHGVPYFFLVAKENKKSSKYKIAIYPLFYLLCVLLYFLETRLFGIKSPILISIALMPQIVHYYLDGIIWRRSVRVP